MSDTPRTDATVKQYDGSWFAHEGPAYDLLELCRELERERNAIREKWQAVMSINYAMSEALRVIEEGLG